MRLLLDAFSRLVWTVENPEDASLLHPPAARHQVGSTWFQGAVKGIRGFRALEGLFVQGFGVWGMAGGAARGGQEVALRCAAGWHWWLPSLCKVPWEMWGNFSLGKTTLQSLYGPVHGEKPAFVPHHQPPPTGHQPWPQARAQGEGAAVLGARLFGGAQAAAGGFPVGFFRTALLCLLFPSPHTLL